MSVRGFQATWVLPCVPGSLPIQNGAIVLDSEQRVLALGPADDLRARFPAADWSVEHAILLPGLVNAHTHLELSALRGHTKSGGGFGPWVTSMMAARGRLQPEQDVEAIDAAVSELLRFGTVAVGEVTNTLSSVDALSSAPMLGRIFHEIFGMRRETADVMRGMARQARAERLSWPSHLSYAPAPHTLYSLHPDSAQAIVADARALCERTSLHLSEHAAERAFLLDGTGPFSEFLRVRGADPADWQPPGVSPVAYAEQLGLLAPDVVAVHLCATTSDELRIVKRSGSPVVLCPRSNLFIELKLPPLYDILEAGLSPGLGSDSLASNTTLDVLAEAATLRDRFPSVAPLRLIEMATFHGAEALGLGHRVGSLRQGLSPGLLAVDLTPEQAASVRDPAAHLLRFHSAPRRILARPRLPTSQHSLGEAP